MGKKFKYVSLNRIISKLYRDLGLEEISEVDVVEWAGEALEGIGAIGLYEQAVAFVEVENYQANLPNGLHNIIQVARDNTWTKEVCPADIILDCDIKKEKDTTDKCGCNANSNVEGYPIPLDCNGTPIVDYEVAYYRPYFDLQYEYIDWCKSNQYQKYTPVRLSNHSFFGSLVCEEKEGLYIGSTDEYTIDNDRIKTSFETGFIAIAYNRQKVDIDTGYPLIPDDYSVTSAITWYITWKYMARMWYMGKEGYERKMREAESQWQWYCTQAANMAFKPYGVDEHQNLLEQSYRMIPTHDSYYSFFGKLGRKQSNKWKNPQGRGLKFRGI